MKAAIWIVFGLLLALWSGGLWAVAEFTRWFVGMVASGQAVDWSAAVEGWRVPAWLAWWVQPGQIEAALGALAAALEAARTGLPYAASAAGWLVAGVWLVWGAGVLLMLLVAMGFHLLVSRMLLPEPRPA